MAQFVTRCNEKYRKEMKMKDLSPAEEGYFPCKLRWLEPSKREFNGEYNSDNFIIKGLAFLELGKVLSRHAL